MGKVLVTESYLTNIASAIRSKLSTSEAFKPSEMASGIMSISGGGGSITVEPLSVSANGTYSASEGYAFSPVEVNVEGGGGLVASSLSVSQNGVYSAPSGYAFDPVTVNVEGSGHLWYESYWKGQSLVSVVDNELTSLRTNMFFSYINAIDLTFNSVVGTSRSDSVFWGLNSAFRHAKKLDNVAFPNLDSRGTVQLFDTFYYASGSAEIYISCASISAPQGFCGANFPKITLNCVNFSGNSCFAYTNADELNFPTLTKANFSSVFVRTSIKKINAPLLSSASITHSMFYSASALVEVNMPLLEGPLETNAFSGCSALESVNMPKITYLSYGVFGGCKNLKELYFPECSLISGAAFYNCQSLSKLTLLYSSVVTLSGSGAFQSTPMNSSTKLGYWGSVFVPLSLVDAYKADSVWSWYADRITAFE